MYATYSELIYIYIYICIYFIPIACLLLKFLERVLERDIK